jgi:hypothetical protein
MYVGGRSCAKTPMYFCDTAQVYARRVNGPKYVTLIMTILHSAQYQAHTDRVNAPKYVTLILTLFYTA